MRVHSPRRVSHSPLAVAIGISLGLHLLVLALALFVRTPSNSPTMKRGEPLFVELPQGAQPPAPALPAADGPTAAGGHAAPPRPPASQGPAAAQSGSAPPHAARSPGGSASSAGADRRGDAAPTVGARAASP